MFVTLGDMIVSLEGLIAIEKGFYHKVTVGGTYYNYNIELTYMSNGRTKTILCPFESEGERDDSYQKLQKQLVPNWKAFYGTEGSAP